MFPAIWARALQTAIRTIAPGGWITVWRGTCRENVSIDRDVLIAGEGYDAVILQALDPSRPVVDIARGVTANIMGVTIQGGSVGISSVGDIGLAYSVVKNNAAGGIALPGGRLIADSIDVSNNLGPGIGAEPGGRRWRVPSRLVTDRPAGRTRRVRTCTGRSGGFTIVAPLRRDSLAIDHVPPEMCRLAVDQRNRTRPDTVGKACDIGAFERQPDDTVPCRTRGRLALVNPIQEFRTVHWTRKSDPAAAWSRARSVRSPSRTARLFGIDPG